MTEEVPCSPPSRCPVTVRHGSLKLGSLVRIRYADHQVYCDDDPSRFNTPPILETVGWLSFASKDAVRLDWERFADRETFPVKSRFTPYGMTIVRSAILELECLG